MPTGRRLIEVSQAPDVGRVETIERFVQCELVRDGLAEQIDGSGRSCCCSFTAGGAKPWEQDTSTQ